MRRKLRSAGYITLVLAVGLSICLLAVYQASQQVPEFYLQALAEEPARQEEAGDELEREVLELHNHARRDGAWEAEFSEEQINGWLASDMPEKFPYILPRSVSDPRVAIEPDQVRIACHHRGRKLSTVVSITVDLHLTDKPNQLAIRIRDAQAGSLPLPLKRFLDKISASARNAGLLLTWAQQDGDPIALLTIPGDYEEEGQPRQFQLETLELRSGSVRLTGRTTSQPAEGQDGDLAGSW